MGLWVNRLHRQRRTTRPPCPVGAMDREGCWHPLPAQCQESLLVPPTPAATSQEYLAELSAAVAGAWRPEEVL